MPSSQRTQSADEVLRAAAQAALLPRAPVRRSAWLAAFAIAVVLGSAGWIASLHIAAAHDDARARSLSKLDGQLADLQLLHWRGVAGDLEPQASLVQETLRWRAFRTRAARTIPGLKTSGIEGLLALTASDNAIPHRSIAEVRMSGRPLLDRLKTLSATVDAETRAAARHAGATRARAWRLTALCGALACVVLTILLLALGRTRRAARRAIAAAARAEGERGALQASSRRFHALVRHASEAVVVLDADGAVTFATPSVDGLLGRADLGGEVLSGLVAPED